MLHISNVSTAKEAQSLMLGSYWLGQGRGKVQMLPFNSMILSILLSFLRTMVGYSFSPLHLDFFYCFYTVLFWLPCGKILPEEPLKYSRGHPPGTVPTVLQGSPGKDPLHPLAWPILAPGLAVHYYYSHMIWPVPPHKLFHWPEFPKSHI